MQRQIMTNGFGWSPDGGSYEVKDNKVYWEDGDITDLADGGVFRTMRRESGEHYSEWSDEKRATVKAEWARKREEWQEERLNQLLMCQKQSFPKMDGILIYLDDDDIQVILDAIEVYVSSRIGDCSHCKDETMKARSLKDYIMLNIEG